MVKQPKVQQARTASSDAVRVCLRRIGRAGLGALALALWLFAFASPALAGPPSHPRNSALDIAGFNHACGVAVDSEGDVYVSSAGESKIKVFNPVHTELTSIANANEPCGLAVDSTGKLYVSEKAVGKVVRYTPNAYPFAGTPTYGAPTTIDSSGNAKGISVDPTDNRLYVAEGSRISTYGPDGTLGIDEVQRVTVSSATGGSFRLALTGEGGAGRKEIQLIQIGSPRPSGGTFTLTFNDQTTGPLAFEPNVNKPNGAEVEGALASLSTIGPGNVSVKGFAKRGWWVEFKGALAETDVPLITGDGKNLTGGSKEITARALSDITADIPFGASAETVESALKALNGIGLGNVSVTKVGVQYQVAFTGGLSTTDVEELTGDPSGLTSPEGSNPEFPPETNVGTTTTPFSGHIGEDPLADYSGVAAYTYKVTNETADRYVFAADAATDEVKLFGGPDIRQMGLRKTIDGPKPGEDFGFGAAGAYLAADPGNRNPETGKCVSVEEQACTAGHLLVYDEAHKAVDEFEANGEFLDQLTSAAFADAQPTALAVERSGGANDGTIYVSAGAAAGAKLLAFGPLAAPSRPPLPELSRALTSARAVATDSAGDVYVAAGKAIHVFGPGGSELTEFATPKEARTLAVDSTCKVYMRFGQFGGDPAENEVAYYTPSSCPPQPGTTYSGPVLVATGNSFLKPTSVMAIGINPANNRLFVGGYNGDILELGSAAEGSPILDPCFGCSLPLGGEQDIGVYGANGHVYVSMKNEIYVIDETGTEVLARITGAGSPKGPFGGFPGVIAVDQSNGHVLVFNSAREAAREYDASGAFITEFGKFTNLAQPSGIAIDNGAFSPNKGNTYVAYDDTAPGSFDLTAFGPLAYGEPPLATTGIASGLGAGNATLNGTVDPRGFELTECKFEYVSAAAFEATGFSDLSSGGSKPCVPGLAEIGKDTGAVAVHATTDPLGEPEARYRFRLVAENKYGESEGKVWLFGSPVLTTKNALPVLYDEATLRAEVDPSGLATKYRFEYVTQEHFEAEGGFASPKTQSTPVAELPPGDGPVAVQAPLTGLIEGTTYHSRIVAENEAKTVPGPDQTFATLERVKSPPCPNTEYRTGLSAKLPECRAYELVTPADTRASTPHATTANSAGQIFNNWLVAPRGAGAGERVAYFALTLPGFEGTGKTDAYRAQRATGPHPAAGWANELFGPTYAQAGSDAKQAGVASDQRYGFFFIRELDATFERGQYLRTPSGFEPIAKGSLGTDLRAAGGGTRGPFVSSGGAHVVFFSDKHLEPEAAPEGAVSIYDRVAGGSSAEVVSVPPPGATPGQVAAFKAAQISDPETSYLGASEDGSTTVFKVGVTMYARDESTGTEIVAPEKLAEVGEGLECAHGPAVVEVKNREIEWLRNSTPIPGASGRAGEHSLYTTVPADAGAAVQCRVLVHEGGTGSVWVSNPVIHVKPLLGTEPPIAPDVIAAPTPASPVAGTVESCDPGAWTGAGEPLAFQWYVDGDPVPGATSETYEVKAADVPGAIQCLVKATNAAGSVSAASPVTYTDPPPDPIVPSASASADLQIAFAGVSEDGERVFYTTGSGSESESKPGRLFRVDLDSQNSTEIAPESIFVNVSPDGSRALFTSEEALTGAEENEAGETAEAGEHNLYLWDGAATRFVAILDAEDFASFGGNGFVNLRRWAPAVSTGTGIGRSDSPTRATPGGEVFVFQSHARLTPYDNEGHGEIYRYEPGAESGGQLVCVSCDPTGAPPSADAQLLVNSGVAGVIRNTTLVPNLTDDGEAVFFQSPDRLLPEDANDVQDVYQWKAEGAGGCGRVGGCLALISSGQGEEPSYLYGMTADGSDVFFETPEKLVGADIPGSPSIYDARVKGGIPDPPAPAPCQGDACQGQGSIPPPLPAPASTGSGEGPGEPRPSRPCPKGKRKVRRHGKARCVAKPHRPNRHHRRAHANRRVPK